MVIGLDVGGTNIDAVIIKDRQIIKRIKRPLYGDDLLDSVLSSLDELLQDYDQSMIKRINLSTTISTNAIVKNEISTVGMLIQSGPGLPIDHLACGHENRFLTGSIDHRGRVIKGFDLKEIEAGIEYFKEKRMESCAVVTKFSTRNPSHEKKIAELAKGHFDFVTQGAQISGKLNFPRRVYTAYLNSAVYKTFNSFAKSVEESLQKRNINVPIYILKADGGTMDIKSAKDKPVESILSGPAASFMGMNALLPTDFDSLFLDIGGTTTDIFFLANGNFLFEPLGIEIDQYKTLIRSIYSVSIGLGGDSSITIEEGGLKIGPEKEVTAYALGANKATPTDAMILLGLTDMGDKARAKEIMEILGEKLQLSGQEMAKLILETMAKTIKETVHKLLENINGKPVYTVKEVLLDKKIKPQEINIIGGPAKGLAPILEKVFGLPCYYPADYHIANAIGAALAKPTMDINLVADTQRKILSIPELAIYEKIKGPYDLQKARDQAIALLKKQILLMDQESRITDEDIEIIDESSFNMIDGFSTVGQNIRIQAQVKPGLIYNLRSEM